MLTNQGVLMHKPIAPGAIALVAAPLVAITGIAIAPTMSDDAANQVTAFTAHHSAMVLGFTVLTLAVFLLIAGTAWLALAVNEQSPRLALTGGILGIGGLLVVLFEDGVSAATPAIATGLNHVAATALITRVHSGAITALEPLSIVGDIGLAVLGFAAVKAGAPRWTSVVIAVGAMGEGVGFASGTKPLLLIMFTMLLVGLAGACANLVAAPAPSMGHDQMAVVAG
jgi:hypothetical protein